METASLTTATGVARCMRGSKTAPVSMEARISFSCSGDSGTTPRAMHRSGAQSMSTPSTTRAVDQSALLGWVMVMTQG